MKEVIHKIVKLMNYSDEIIHKAVRNADVECHNASNEKLKKMIDYQLTPFEEGLTKTIEWYKENIK